MNIYYVDSDPCQAARYLCDQHVKGMLGESVALLSYASWKNGGPRPHKRVVGIYESQGPVRWLMTGLGNFDWLREHAWELWSEYWRRFGTDNAYRRHLEELAVDPPGLPDIGRTPFLPASVKGYEHLFTVPDDPVASCRRYYALHTLYLPAGGVGIWKHGGRPAWVDEIRASVTTEEHDAIRHALRPGVAGKGSMSAKKDTETGLDLYEADRTTALR